MKLFDGLRRLVSILLFTALALQLSGYTCRAEVRLDTPPVLHHGDGHIASHDIVDGSALDADNHYCPCPCHGGFTLTPPLAVSSTVKAAAPVTMQPPPQPTDVTIAYFHPPKIVL